MRCSFDWEWARISSPSRKVAEIFPALLLCSEYHTVLTARRGNRWGHCTMEMHWLFFRDSVKVWVLGKECKQLLQPWYRAYDYYQHTRLISNWKGQVMQVIQFDATGSGQSSGFLFNWMKQYNDCLFSVSHKPQQIHALEFLYFNLFQIAPDGWRSHSSDHHRKLLFFFS